MNYIIPGALGLVDSNDIDKVSQATGRSEVSYRETIFQTVIGPRYRLSQHFFPMVMSLLVTATKNLKCMPESI